jgi:hypothetical protein
MGLRLLVTTLLRFNIATPWALRKLRAASFPGAEEPGYHDEVCRAIVYLSKGSLKQLDSGIATARIDWRDVVGAAQTEANLRRHRKR